MDNSKCCTSHIRLFAYTHPHTDERLLCKGAELLISSIQSTQWDFLYCFVQTCTHKFTHTFTHTFTRTLRCAATAGDRTTNLPAPTCPMSHEGRKLSRTTASKVKNVNAQMCSGNKRMVNYSPVISQSNHITVTNWKKYENVYPDHGHMASNPHTLWAPSLPFTTASLSKGNKMTEEALNAHSL